MIIPRTYIENYNNKIITYDMLNDCLYGVNKRAKNNRDLYRTLNMKDSLYNRDIQKEVEKRVQEYYTKKRILLSLLKPVAIHCEIYKKVNKKRYYSNNKKYQYYLKKAKTEDSIIETGRCRRKGKMVNYFDYLISVNTHKYYYLFYDLYTHSYHTPISENELSKYDNLPIINLEYNIKTIGWDNKELLPVNFIDKIIELIESKQFVFVKEN